MGITPGRKEYIYQYAKEKLKRIPLDVPKTTYEDIKAHATSMGESVNGFIKRAISETIARDAPESPPEAASASAGSGGIPASPKTLEAAQGAAERTGEAVADFVRRAVETQVKRDKSAIALGINPATGEKLKKEA